MHCKMDFGKIIDATIIANCVLDLRDIVNGCLNNNIIASLNLFVNIYVYQNTCAYFKN